MGLSDAQICHTMICKVNVSDLKCFSVILSIGEY